MLFWTSRLFKTAGLSPLQNINSRFLSTHLMYNANQSLLGPGTPDIPTPRFPTAQSPMPAFVFMGRPESPQAMSPAPPRWRSPTPSMLQIPLPTVSPLERPETLGHPNFEQENPFGLKQLSRLHGILDDSNSRASDSSDDPPNQNSQAESLAQLHMRLVVQGPRTHQPGTSSTDFFATWNNSNHQPPIDPSATMYPDFSSPESLAQLHRRLVIQGPTTNQPGTSSTDFFETWKNLNHQPPIQPATTYPDFSPPESLAQLHRRLVIQIPTTNQPRTSSTDLYNTRNNSNHQAPVNPQSAAVYPDSSSAATSVDLSPLQYLPLIPLSHLQVRFGGDPKSLGWNTLRPSVETFIKQTYDNPLKLTVTWSPSSSEDDPSGWMGGRTFKSLFDLLSTEMEPGQTLLTSVECISINVPEECEKADVIPVTGLERTPEEQAGIATDRVDLGSASNLKELFLRGSHIFFAQKLSNLPAESALNLAQRHWLQDLGQRYACTPSSMFSLAGRHLWDRLCRE